MRLTVVVSHRKSIVAFKKKNKKKNNAASPLKKYDKDKALQNHLWNSDLNMIEQGGEPFRFRHHQHFRWWSRCLQNTSDH